VPAGCGVGIDQGEQFPEGCRKDQGQALIYDGETGEVLREINIPNADLPPTSCSETPDCGNLGYDQVPAQLAQCGGSLSIQFTGYFERRIRGEQLAYELNAGQTRTP